MIDMTKVNSILAGLELTVKQIVKFVIPVAIVLIALEVLFGVSVGLVGRITTLLSISIKDAIVYAVAIYIAYKAIVK